MNSIEDNVEKDKILNWAKNNVQNYENENQKFQNSYYTLVKNDEINICEYWFEDLPTIMNILNELWLDDVIMKDVQRAVAISIIKHKPSNDETLNSINKDVDLEISPFVYMF